jgi:ABC-type glycerol-3-phosphate transport system substrate-binding protein
MVFEGDWLVQSLIEVSRVEWTPAPLPTVAKRPAALIVADVLSIPKGGRHPEGAAEFILFAARPEQIEQLALGQVKISPLQCWSERFLAQHENPKLRVLREILSTAQLFYDPRVLGWTSYLEQIKGAFDLIWSGQRTPTQALATIQGIRKPT